MTSKHQFEFGCEEVDLLSQSLKKRRFESKKMKGRQQEVLDKLYAASIPCDEKVDNGDYDDDE